MKLNKQDCLDGKHDTELNIAICEWLGWKCVHGASSWNHEPTGLSPEHKGSLNSVISRRRLPNHILGIEALGNVHEAEKCLSVGERVRYSEVLQLLWTNRTDRAIPTWWFLHVTARQRVVALLSVVKPELFT